MVVELPPPTFALAGSSVPQLFLMSFVHLSWAIGSPAFFALHSRKACSQRSYESR